MFKELNPLLHSELRLAVMSILVSVEEAEFSYLKQQTGATAGNLSVQIDKLNKADYVEVIKTFKGKMPCTICKITQKGLEAFEDIEKASSIALGDPASVPAGQYAEEALTSLGIWDRIQDKVSFGTNVTEVLNQVAASSADAGIVYATDAASMAEQVDVIAEAPEGSLKKKVIYPVAVLKGSAHSEEAADFVEFLKTEEAMKVFEEYGFTKGE